MRGLEARRLPAWVLGLLFLAGGCGDASPRAAGEAGASRGSGAQGSAMPAPAIEEGSFPVVVEDDAGAPLLIESAPRRILSLVPSATEILLALGQEELLVGRTDFDLDPRVAALVSVGGGLQPSMEIVVSLRPDLVIHFRAESDPGTPARLDAAGIPHLAIRPDGLADVDRIIGLIGASVGRPAAADSLRAALREELDEVARLVRGANPPRVAFLLGGDPPWVAGPGTFLGELVRIAGGENIFEDTDELYTPVSVEEIIRRAPDLLVAPEGATIPTALRDLSLRHLPEEVQSPGLGAGSSARLLARILHPDRVP